MHFAFKGLTFTRDQETFTIDSPAEWFKQQLTDLETNNNNLHTNYWSKVNSIVLTFHVPINDDEYVESTEYYSVLTKMKNWNTVNARKPIVAAFSGHFHELLGHFPQKLTGMYTTSASWPRPFYDDCPADRPVRHFLPGSRAHQGFLSLKMYDHH